MAPKTYVQQIADLKQEKQTLLDEVERLRKEVEDLQPIRSQLDEARAALLAAAKENTQNDSGIKAQLTDANQRAESEAAHARRVVDENTRLAHVNGQLLNKIEVIERTQGFLADKDAQISQLGAELQNLSVRQSQRERQLNDLIREKELEVDGMASELRQLRIESRAHPNEIAQLKQDVAEVISRAEEASNQYKEASQWYSAELDKAKTVIKNYKAIVSSLPDTKAELLSVLNTVHTD